MCGLISTVRIPFMLVVLVLVASLLTAGCTGPTATSAKTEVTDPKMISQSDFDRVRNGLTGMNLGQILLQKTHPTGKFISSQPPRMVLSSDKREIVAKVTAQWAGGITEARYETDFTAEISKDRVRLIVDRDTAILQIKPENLRLAELDLTNVIKPLW